MPEPEKNIPTSLYNPALLPALYALMETDPSEWVDETPGGDWSGGDRCRTLFCERFQVSVLLGTGLRETSDTNDCGIFDHDPNMLVMVQGHIQNQRIRATTLALFQGKLGRPGPPYI